MTAELSSTDWGFLRRAMGIGRQGWGRVHPNPMVGCVLVKDGEIVAEGWHEEVGGPHAEAHALSRAGHAARGATAYVSLEPCDHYGRTPPCSEALIEAGISCVVYGASDPGPASAGGDQTLREGGVEVIGPVLSPEQSRAENPAFFFNQEHGATYVALKLAQTLDGRIASGPGTRTPITGEESQRETHRLRAGFDAIMVGSNTVLVDDPLLTVRGDLPFRKQPSRIILDSDAEIPDTARLFEDVHDSPVIVFCSETAPDGAVRRLQDAGGTVQRVPKAEVGLSMDAVLSVCWERGIRSIFCEGGGILGSSLIESGWARRLFLFVAPFVLGERAVPAFPGLASEGVWKAWQPVETARVFGRDVLLTFDRID
ncbi:MAG: bifunctional diaminohydroxyphosphoribosylaminopyrimidine deaminase/5-amino-6-(5-phosphoribosylamino)uracil reductase RibD [Gemmatimonadetes bacterium]|nr:bifunctional diaminohydroxyphosphoribosylaminopyrimidine deaminase/5-amino-6-(5-phosphoribosylamino)uracil reductase RibD [Gemmatimonadota bacterium]NNM06142.1 bifunctional diaminohydroxyphosphoribosylaminopyrimidine deaminase/5-amino-6-(5-phosphoribosylamino)uracil reductase RibD [Gemmatimonadota bacterium]